MTSDLHQGSRPPGPRDCPGRRPGEGGEFLARIPTVDRCCSLYQRVHGRDTKIGELPEHDQSARSVDHLKAT